MTLYLGVASAGCADRYVALLFHYGAPAGVDIADDGTFLFREAVRINFGHLVAQQFNGDMVKVSILAVHLGTNHLRTA